MNLRIVDGISKDANLFLQKQKQIILKSHPKIIIEKSCEEILDKALNKNDAESQYNIGYFYYHGRNGMVKDLRRAFYWIKKAADNGNKIAQVTLGICYEKGLGVPINLEEALKWYETSAEGAMGQELGAAHAMRLHKNYDAAIKVYEAILKKNPSNSEASMGKSRAEGALQSGCGIYIAAAPHSAVNYSSPGAISNSGKQIGFTKTKPG